MKAVRLEGGAVGISEVDAPVPAPDEALIRITAAGVCHSDLHLARSDWAGIQTDTIGHEAIGVVEALGPGADRFVNVGDRVILSDTSAQDGYDKIRLN
jgi:D-arabinose 1-dehydrogenase-like Zn-dependent alcohol dehydrogenase